MQIQFTSYVQKGPLALLNAACIYMIHLSPILPRNIFKSQEDFFPNFFPKEVCYTHYNFQWGKCLFQVVWFLPDCKLYDWRKTCIWIYIIQALIWTAGEIFSTKFGNFFIVVLPSSLINNKCLYKFSLFSDYKCRQLRLT